MKIILSVVSKSRVVEELLEAIKSSVDVFSQDTSFDFQLVRIDNFLVPPGYVERYDDACFSYWSKRNPLPSPEEMKPILMYPSEQHDDEKILQYAAVLYRKGEFRDDAYWGALFYLLHEKWSGEEKGFIRLDCQEKIQSRDKGPTSDQVLGMFWPTADKVDAFTLPWVLAYAEKKIEFVYEEKDITYHTKDIVKEFNCFGSGLGQVDALVNKVGRDSFARLPIRHGWAWAAIPSVEPSPYDGVGEKLKKLFEEISPPSK